MSVLWLELVYTMKISLSPWEILWLRPQDFPQAQAKFHRISLISSQYRLNASPACYWWTNCVIHFTLSLPITREIWKCAHRTKCLTLHTSHCTYHTKHLKLYNLRSTPHVVHITMYTSHCIHHILQVKLYTQKSYIKLYMSKLPYIEHFPVYS